MVLPVEGLHTATEKKDEVQGRLLLDVVIREGTAVLELFLGEDEALLVGKWQVARLVCTYPQTQRNERRGLDYVPVRGPDTGLPHPSLEQCQHGTVPCPRRLGGEPVSIILPRAALCRRRRAGCFKLQV